MSADNSDLNSTIRVINMLNGYDFSSAQLLGKKGKKPIPNSGGSASGDPQKERERDARARERKQNTQTSSNTSSSSSSSTSSSSNVSNSRVNSLTNNNQPTYASTMPTPSAPPLIQSNDLD
jgi:hypothetical protein